MQLIQAKNDCLIYTACMYAINTDKKWLLNIYCLHVCN